MGITVLSSVSANSALPSLNGGASSDALPFDFAALLGEQISSGLAGLMLEDSTHANLAGKDIAALMQASGKAIADSKAETSTELAIDPEQLAELAAMNPLLASQIMPPTPQTPENLHTRAGDLENTEQGSGKGLIALIEDSPKESNLLGAMATAFPRPEGIASHSLPAPSGFDKALADTGAEGKSIQLSLASFAPQRAEASQAKLSETANIAVDLPATQTPQSQSTFSAVLTAAGSQSHTQAEPSMHIPTPIHETRWAQDFGEKIVWFAKNEHQTAQININPPQLGPMQINLSMNGDQATAVFASPHAEVRQAIEDAMPRLREMLSSAGISLGDANVGTQLPQQNRDNASQFSNSSPNGGRFQDENAILGGNSKTSGNSGTLPIQRGRGLVDLFA